MNGLLFANILIVDATSAWNGQRVDLVVSDGSISRITPPHTDHPHDMKTIDGSALWCSPGWVDTGVQVCGPGLEHREDLASVTRAAARGGFTAIACLPNTEPALHSKSELLYLRNESRRYPVDCLPIGAVSKHCSGSDLTEMYDLHSAGAVAFSNGSEPIADAGLMLRALQYVCAFGSRVINSPLDWSVCPEGQIHEGTISTEMGLKGIPSIAEELMVQRDLYLAGYADSSLHLTNISTARSVELIRAAKSRGIRVTASVSLLNLVYTDETVREFDTAFKVLPPLRSGSDREALITGLKDGTIDAITANHVPWDEESKKKEFPYAAFGASGLETLYSLYQTELSGDITAELLVDKLAHGPRMILGQPENTVKEGAHADLTIVRPEAEWVCTKNGFASKGHNSPLLGKTLNGLVEGIVKDGVWLPSVSSEL